MLFAIKLILVAEWRVLSHMDVFLMVELDKVFLLQPRVQFHLVDHWNSGDMVEKALHFLLRKVADPNSLGLFSL